MNHKYTVKKKTDAYRDLYADWEYEVTNMNYSGAELRVFIKNNRRRYLASEFNFFKDGKPIGVKDAYDAIKFRKAMMKVGMGR